MLSRQKQNGKWDLSYADLKGDRRAIPFLVTEFNEWLGCSPRTAAGSPTSRTNRERTRSTSGHSPAKGKVADLHGRG